MSDHKAKSHGVQSAHSGHQDHHEAEHNGLIRTPKQLIVVATLALLVPVLLAFLGSLWATSGPRINKEESAKSVAARIAPVGSIKQFDPNEAPPAPVVAVAAVSDKPKAGDEVYNGACVACHGAGVAGAPKQGDKGAWAPRIAQGAATLYDHAIKGYQGKAGVMPAKGGNAALSDAEVKAAVDFMVAAAK
jgi:cytochrome c5